MDRPELAEDPRFASHAARGAHQGLLDEIVADWTRGRPLASLLETLEAEGVPCGRIYGPADMLDDPQYLARDAIVTTGHPVFGAVRMQNAFPKLSATPGEVRWPGPPLGAHTDSVLSEWAGVGPEALAGLRERGVI
jgi:formyl-CoA transferase